MNAVKDTTDHTNNVGQEEEEDHLHMSLPSLPSELLTQIFSYLSLADVYGRVSLVCKRFNDVRSQSGGVWSEISLCPDGRRGGDATFFFQRSMTWILLSPALRKIKIYAHQRLQTLAVTSLENCKGLESMTLKNLPRGEEERLGPSILRAIGGRETLRRIHLFYNTFEEGVFQTEAAAGCLNNLTHFTFGGDNYGDHDDARRRRRRRNLVFGDKELRAIADHCPRVKGLHLHTAFCETLTCKGVDYFLKRSRETLRSLRLPEGGGGVFNEGDVFELHRSIGECRLLETLKNVRAVDSVLAALSNLTLLVHLEFRGRSPEGFLFDPMFDRGGGPRSLTHLTCLGLFHLDDDDLDAISANCPELTSLELRVCFDACEGVRSVLVRCAKLRSLALCGFRGVLSPDVFREAVALRVLKIDWPRLSLHGEEQHSRRMQELVDLARLVPKLLVRDYWDKSKWMGKPL